MGNDAETVQVLGRTMPKSRRYWLEAGLVVAFWTLMAVLMVSSRLLDARRPDPEPRLLHFIFFRSYLWAVLTPLVFWVSHKFSIERPDWPIRVGGHLFVALLVGAVVDMIGDAFVFYYVQPPWLDEGDTFNTLEDLFELDFLYEFAIYLAVLTAGFARDYFLRYQERQREATQLRAQTAELQGQLAEARLQALRMQINPHFLFNTLHAISTLVERDPGGVRRMIARLSELLRYTLEETDTQEVPLDQELDFLEGYLEIQRIRFQGRLDVEEDVPEETRKALVPNLILQPLVENAIKHGASQIEGEGRILIQARRAGDRLQVSVHDNGPGLSAGSGDGAPRGFGLRNTQERLESLYGDDQELALVPSESGGLVARITLPFHTSADLHTAELPEREFSHRQ
jgi:two-component sensor histidine kinase